MFNILNKKPNLRKYSPLVCKFLDWMSSLFHESHWRSQGASYLLDKMELRDCKIPPFGFGIAFAIRQPGLIRIGNGRD